MGLKIGNTAFMFNEQALIKEIKKLKLRAYKLTGNKADGEDLLQEVCFKALKYRNSFKCKNKLKNWLYVIMCNTHRDLYNKKKVPIVYGDVLEEDHPVENNKGEYILSENLINELLTSLPEGREKVMRYFIDGHRLDEIATMTGKPINTVKSDIFLAREKIRTTLHKINI